MTDHSKPRPVISENQAVIRLNKDNKNASAMLAKADHRLL